MAAGEVFTYLFRVWCEFVFLVPIWNPENEKGLAFLANPLIYLAPAVGIEPTTN